MWPALVAVGRELLGAWQGERKRKQEIKIANHNAEVQRIVKGDNNAAAADQASIVSRGWKDDYLLILTTLPVLVVFVEPLVLCLSSSYVAGSASLAVGSGFNALASMPEYYWYALAVVYIDTFGFRRMFREVFAVWLKKRLG